MQQLLQQQHARLDQVSSSWASFEAKVIALVNSCLLAPAGQVSCAAPLCSVAVRCLGCVVYCAGEHAIVAAGVAGWLL
jgi:hypothetical protein